MSAGTFRHGAAHLKIMFGRLFRLLIILPLLGGLWAFLNTAGITKEVSKATGINIPSSVTIPGLEQILKAERAVSNAKATARRAAIKAVKKQVAEQYGPEVARMIPRDLTSREVRRLAVLAASGASLADIEALLGDMPDMPEVTLPGGGNDGGTLNVLGDAKTFNTARTQLAALDVKGRAPMTGYSREQFGSEWSDSAGNFGWTGNGCDTRNDVLRRDLVKIEFAPGSKCEVESGVLRYERYTGTKNYRFDAGDDAYETDLDVEHVVALGSIWVTGGQQLSAPERAAIANDPLNLFAADPSSNRQKGDADAATWLPSNKAYRCGYVSLQIQVKTKYDLWVTAPEKAAMEQVLAGCPK